MTLVTPRNPLIRGTSKRIQRAESSNNDQESSCDSDLSVERSRRNSVSSASVVRPQHTPRLGSLQEEQEPCRHDSVSKRGNPACCDEAESEELEAEFEESHDSFVALGTAGALPGVRRKMKIKIPPRERKRQRRVRNAKKIFETTASAALNTDPLPQTYASTPTADTWRDDKGPSRSKSLTDDESAQSEASESSQTESTEYFSSPLVSLSSSASADISSSSQSETSKSDGEQEVDEPMQTAVPVIDPSLQTLVAAHTETDTDDPNEQIKAGQRGCFQRTLDKLGLTGFGKSNIATVAASSPLLAASSSASVAATVAPVPPPPAVALAALASVGFSPSPLASQLPPSPSASLLPPSPAMAEATIKALNSASVCSAPLAAPALFLPDTTNTQLLQPLVVMEGIC